MQSNTDSEKWQKAIQGIEAKQTDLSPGELQAFAALKALYENNNFETGESGGSIKALKDGLAKHSNNRLLSVHLKNFIALCEQSFTSKTIVAPPVFQPQIIIPTSSPEQQPSSVIPEVPIVPTPAFTPPVITPPPIIVPPSPPQPAGQPEIKSDTNPKGNNKNMTFIIIAAVVLIGGWQIYKNWDANVKPFLENLGLIHKAIPVTGITLDKTELFLLDGETEQITATIVPEDATDKSVIWLSSDSTVAIVDTTGLVTTVAPGTATVIASSNNSISDTCIVFVQELIPDVLDSDSTLQVQDPVVIEQPTQKTQETVIQKPLTEVQKTAAKTYSFGKYAGSLRNGIPEGDGKMTYNRRIQIAKHDTGNPPHYAEAGDYFDGSWGNGDIVSGYLYGRDGSIKERILAPKRFNPYDISKD